MVDLLSDPDPSTTVEAPPQKMEREISRHTRDNSSSELSEPAPRNSVNSLLDVLGDDKPKGMAVLGMLSEDKASEPKGAGNSVYDILSEVCLFAFQKFFIRRPSSDGREI